METFAEFMMTNHRFTQEFLLFGCLDNYILCLRHSPSEDSRFPYPDENKILACTVPPYVDAKYACYISENY